MHHMDLTMTKQNTKVLATCIVITHSVQIYNKQYHFNNSMLVTLMQMVEF